MIRKVYETSPDARDAPTFMNCPRMNIKYLLSQDVEFQWYSAQNIYRVYLIYEKRIYLVSCQNLNSFLSYIPICIVVIGGK